MYEKLLAKNLAYVGDLLDLVAKMVTKEYATSLPSRGGAPASACSFKQDEFDKRYREALIEAEKRFERRKGDSKTPVDFWDSKKGQELIKNKGAKPDAGAKSSKGASGEGESGKEGSEGGKDGVDSASPAKRLSKIEIAAQKRAAKAAEKAAKGETPAKTPDWHKKEKKLTVDEVNKSKESSRSGVMESAAVDVAAMKFEDEEEDLDEEEFDEEEASSGASSASGFGLFKFIKGLTQKELTEANLQPVMDDIKAHLIAKNVASDIADSICDSVSQSLIGQNHGNFKSISTVVKNAMAESLTRILTPKRHIDISREIQAAKDAGRPYSIVFVGVNGVGKSTSLAKVCAWLLKQNHRVMIAACDTFRSGAVEQLKVHSEALGGVPIYEAGYGKDAAFIAQQAIAKANTDAEVLQWC